VLTGALLAAWSCTSHPALAAEREPGTRSSAAGKVVEPIFVGGYQGDWQYYGWAEREPRTSGPEKLKMEKQAGWILNNSKLKGAFGGLTFRFRAPADLGDFLQVRVDSDLLTVPSVKVGPQHRKDLADGWSEVFIPMAELNPRRAAFARLVIRAAQKLPAPGLVEFDEVGLTEGDGKQAAEPELGPGVPAAFTVDCTAPTTPISPLVYGIAFSSSRDQQSDEHWKLNPAARRWGGNAMTRYNWELNARNTGADWYYENVSLGASSWKAFLSANQERGVVSALTVPTIGWVAKDTRSVGFPVAEVGSQRNVDGERGAGDGMSFSGKPLASGPPTRTSVEAPPDFIRRWVQAIGKHLGPKASPTYILDNEPALWSDTHRDIHPEPLTYDELWERTRAYGAAVREADPHALIAGPAEWGWTGYLYSAADMVAGYRRAPDRKAHGDVPLIEWYLQKLAAHEKRTGQRLLDILDLHFYPQAKGIGVGEAGETDPETNRLRIRSTRGLWDPSYVDESWIGEPVQLIPRMKGWVDRNYPGRKLSLGEYSFGAEKHLSGGLALAEALGRFGQQGLYSAYLWTYPKEGTPAFWAFRAFRNYDGQGATFQQYSMPARAPENASIFAARSLDASKATVVLLNFSPGNPLDATVALRGCPAVETRRVFSYSGEPAGLAEEKSQAGRPYRLAPYSITVLELGWGKRSAPRTR
jgi:hypothetical protein